MNNPTMTPEEVCDELREYGYLVSAVKSLDLTFQMLILAEFPFPALLQVQLFRLTVNFLQFSATKKEEQTLKLLLILLSKL